MEEKIMIENAIIDKISLTMGEHSSLVLNIGLKYGAGLQCFGGICLRNITSKEVYDIAGHYIQRCMEVCGVQDFDEMEGKCVRVKHSWSKVYAIGHIIEDNWFEPNESYKNLNK